MSKKRIINGAIAIAIAIGVMAMTIYYWNKIDGENLRSLAGSILGYGAMLFGLWMSVDTFIKERERDLL